MAHFHTGVSVFSSLIEDGSFLEPKEAWRNDERRSDGGVKITVTIYAGWACSSGVLFSSTVPRPMKAAKVAKDSEFLFAFPSFADFARNYFFSNFSAAELMQ